MRELRLKRFIKAFYIEGNMKIKNIHHFTKMKQNQEKISMISCYEYWSARILEKSHVDCLLVGDSVGMVVYGHESTVHTTMEMMIRHVEAVRRGAPTQFIVGDMPFGSFRRGTVHAFDCATELIKAGANAVKVEGIDGHEDVVKHLVESGIPVMGHLGLTPQTINQIGGHKVQGRDSDQSQKMILDAKKLEQLGAFSLVLECVPQQLAKQITGNISIATIGIGAGADNDGQVLVLHDLLGVDSSFYPKFLKKYEDSSSKSTESINAFVSDVKTGLFPTSEHTFQ